MRVFIKKHCLGLLFFAALLSAALVAEAYDKMICGIVERMTFVPEKVTMPAKLDTGAKTSSLNGTHVVVTEEDGKSWVSFVVRTRRGDFKFKKPLAGYVKIKQRHSEMAKNKDEEFIARPVVLMEVELGNRQALIEVNLANRNNFIYPFLLGREAITQLGLVVDPAQRYTVRGAASTRAVSSDVQAQ